MVFDINQAIIVIVKIVIINYKFVFNLAIPYFKG